MDPLTKSLLILAAGLIAGAGVCWAVMTIGQLRQRVDQLTPQLAQKREEAERAEQARAQLWEERRQAEHEHAQQLAAKDKTIAQLTAEADLLRRTAWPGNLTIDQRAWASNIANLVEISAGDQLDALMRLSPDAVHRLFEKVAPHLVKKDGPK